MTKSDAQISRQRGQLWSRNAQISQRGRLESSSTRSSLPTDHPRPVPLAVVSLDGGWGQWESRQSTHARQQSNDEALGCPESVRIAAAVHPCLVGPHHVDIQSTGHWAEITLCRGIAVLCLNNHSDAQVSRQRNNFGTKTHRSAREDD